MIVVFDLLPRTQKSAETFMKITPKQFLYRRMLILTAIVRFCTLRNHALCTTCDVIHVDVNSYS